MSLNTQELYNLDYIIRYSNYPRIKNESVAAHSFFVAVEVYKLYEEYNFNIDRAIHLALTHDFPEVYIDDVSHKIKRDFPSVAKALKSAERKIIKLFPKFIQEYIEEFEDGETIESIIVKLGDIIQCKTYSQNEIILGNSGYMKEVYEDSIKREIILKNKISKYLR